MLEYSIPVDFLSQTEQHHRCVQRAIAVLANGGGDEVTPRGISRAKGGVVVNGVPVEISRTYVMAKPAQVDPTSEERAVVDAISEVVLLWERDQESFKARYCKSGWIMGDPLEGMYARSLP